MTSDENQIITKRVTIETFFRIFFNADHEAAQQAVQCKTRAKRSPGYRPCLWRGDPNKHRKLQGVLTFSGLDRFVRPAHHCAAQGRLSRKLTGTHGHVTGASPAVTTSWPTHHFRRIRKVCSSPSAREGITRSHACTLGKSWHCNRTRIRPVSEASLPPSRGSFLSTTFETTSPTQALWTMSSLGAISVGGSCAGLA